MLASVFLLAVSAAAQSVTLPGGTLQGGQCATSNASYFYSVPYAQPPTGELRFKPPQQYNGVLGDATTESPRCVQFYNRFIESPYSEDCLYLNVWTPPNADNLPVKVWLYGGGNTAGSISNPTYNGCNLATDSVVVSVNYRLGPLGFLGLEEFGVQGNMGIQDQLLGLQWVQDNIQAFGGDPSKVLLFGESAGATDTYVIGSLPQASSLIRAGIAESGGGRSLPSSADVNDYGARWASGLNCSDIACLQSLPVSELNVTAPESTSPSASSVDGFDPFVDGQVVPANPAEVGVQVPFIFGSNTQEATLLLLAGGSIEGPEEVTLAFYQAYLNSTYGAAASAVAEQYPVSAYSDTPFPAFTALVRVYTESNFWCTAYAGLTRAARNGVPVWTYRFGQAPTCPWYNNFDASVLQVFGAAHTAEIPYVFGNVNNNPPPAGDCSFTESEKSLSRELIGFWTSMAANGNPGSGWPGFTIDMAQGINVNNGSSSVSPGMVDYSMCGFWSEVRNTISAGASASVTSSSASPPVATYTGGAKSVVADLSYIMAFVAIMSMYNLCV